MKTNQLKGQKCLPVRFTTAERHAITLCARRAGVSRHAWMRQAISRATMQNNQANRAAVAICNLFSMTYAGVGFLGAKHWKDVEEIIQHAIDNSK